MTISGHEFPTARPSGVAGISRSLKTEDMEAELRPKFEALRQFGAPLMHYKVLLHDGLRPSRGEHREGH